MTKEDVSEDVRGEAVLGWASTHQRPVVHQVASAPMPSDCGEASHVCLSLLQIKVILCEEKYVSACTCANELRRQASCDKTTTTTF